MTLTVEGNGKNYLLLFCGLASASSLIKSDSAKIRRQKDLNLYTTYTSIFTLPKYKQRRPRAKFILVILAVLCWTKVSLKVYINYMSAFHT